MSIWRQLRRGVSALVHRHAVDQDIADEVEHYFEQAAAELVARGLSPDAARRAARLELGMPGGAREQVRVSGWEHVVETLAADLRYAARRLRNTPGFATVSVLTLALGIGASTAIFSAVNPILFEPLPYPHASRIVMVSDVSGGGPLADVTFGTYRELAARSRSFDGLAVLKPWQPTVTGPSEPERLEGQRVSAAYFRVLGVSPMIGRDFDASEDQVHGPRVAVLSAGLWQRRFGGDRAIVGRTIPLDGDQYLVIGVMPRGFENVLAPSAELWTTLQYATAFGPQDREWGHHLRMVGRLRSGVSIEQAWRELDRIARTPVPEFARVPWASLKDGLVVLALQDDVTRGVRPALLAVLGAVILVLFIACVNVTNLLLARGGQRRGEFAMRAALGAGRIRLIRQLLTESVLLAIVGGALGMVVAALGVSALVALGPPELPRVNAITVNGAAFGFALGVSTLTGVLVGLVPAVQASRGDLRRGLQEGSRRTAGGHQLARRILIIAEVGLALVLLVSTGLLLRSVQRLFAISPGFNAAGLLTMQVQTAGHRFDDDSARYRFFVQTLDAVRHVHGVTAAAYTSQLPLSGELDEYGVHLESAPSDAPEGGFGALRYAVTPGYVETMGIQIRRGRLLDRGDEVGTPAPVLINESFARHAFPGREAIGQRFRFGPNDRVWDAVVGVVGDVTQTSLAASPQDAVYILTTQWPWVDQRQSLVVRAGGDPAALTQAIKRAIWSVDKDQPIVRVTTMDVLVARSEAGRRFALVVFEAFGLTALVLAAIGLYGVLSSGVAERVREIGVRAALGASPRDILTLVIRQGVALTAVGVVIGLAAAAAASRGLVTLLFGVSRLDPVTYSGVIALVAVASLLACCVPAWRAARVDPSIALRAE